MATPVKRNMAFGKVAACFVLVHTKQPPSDAEFEAYIQFLEQHAGDGGDLRVLVITEGGAPTAAQRMQMNEAQNAAMLDRSISFRVSTVTDSVFVRGVVTALSWFHPVYRAFSPAEMKQALAYLDIPPESFDEVIRVVDRLKGQLDR